MTVRRMMAWAVILAGATLLSIYALDGIVAAAVTPFALQNSAVLGPIVTSIELLFAFPISKFATGMFIMAVALAMFAVRRWHASAWLLLFVGATHVTTRLIAGVLKNVFLRLRPDHALANGTWDDRFFTAGGSSFPSGHAAHFWALFFAAAIAFPKLRIPAFILAVFVSIARVAVNDHYVSDVIASAAIAALVTCGYAALLVPRARRAEKTVAASAVSHPSDVAAG